MKLLPVEPASLLLCSGASDRETRVDFEQRFWPEFTVLRSGWLLNERRHHLRVPWSAELQNAASTTFPFHCSPGKWNPSGYEVHSEVIRFLADRVVLLDYCGEGECWYEHLRRVGVYAEDGVWLAWCDLLNQTVPPSPASPVDVVSTSEPVSCFCGPMTNASGRRVAARRIGTGEWPAGLLDPVAWNRMAARRGADPQPVPMVYERSGHLAPRTIRKVLERTLRVEAVRQLVVHAGTTWNSPSVVETCKVWMDAAPNETHFRVSDGSCTFKGVFTTVAESSAEAAIAFSIVQDAFMEVCSEEGLQIADPGDV